MWFPDSARLQGHHDDARLLSGEDGKVAFVSLSQVTAVESLWCERTEVKQMRLGGVQFGGSLGSPKRAASSVTVTSSGLSWERGGENAQSVPAPAAAATPATPTPPSTVRRLIDFITRR